MGCKICVSLHLINYATEPTPLLLIAPLNVHQMHEYVEHDHHLSMHITIFAYMYIL